MARSRPRCANAGAGSASGRSCTRAQPPLLAVGLSQGSKGRVLLVDRQPESDFVRVRRRSWAQLIRKVWMVDPELCERCGGQMKVIAALSAPAQDSVIRAILEARGEWDPPWLRARAPPANAATAACFEHDVSPVVFSDDTDNVDPESPADDH